MFQLTENWFIEGLQDFEYKKYHLLAYLQGVQERFNQTHLYPAFSELILHYRNLIEFQDSKRSFLDKMKKSLKGIDLDNLRLEYESAKEDEKMKEVISVVEFALPLVKQSLEEGKGIYELIEEQIEIDSVGLLPLNRDEGYFLLRAGDAAEVKAYEYRVTIYQGSDEKFRGLRTSFVASFPHSLTNSLESIKLELIRHREKLPNPATFAIISRYGFPEKEALVPVAKRKFMRHLANFAA